MQTEKNKAVVIRFNKEVIEAGNVASFEELMDPAFINHSAPPSADNGPNGMLNTFNNILRPALEGLTVDIHRQVAEGDIVTTHKTVRGVHRGPLLGIAPTGQEVRIDVMDMVRIRAGKYLEHWGVNTLGAVIASLKGK